VFQVALFWQRIDCNIYLLTPSTADLPSPREIALFISKTCSISSPNSRFGCRFNSLDNPVDQICLCSRGYVLFQMAATLSVQELPKRYLGFLVLLHKDEAVSLPRVRHAVVWGGRGRETKQQMVMESRRLVYLLNFQVVMDIAKTIPSIPTVDLKTVAIRFDLSSPTGSGSAAACSS
jgi:hypothetical protein